MPRRWLVASSAGAFSIALAALAASCSSGDDPGLSGDGLGSTSPSASASSTGSASDGGAPTSCGSTPQTGCPCDTPGQQTGCGQVHYVSGDYVSCSPGTRTCSASGEWGDCFGDRIGDPRGPTRGFILDNFQLDASGCDANACDPSCQNFIDNSVGVDASPDSGLVWNDAGVSLTPIYPDSGPPCTGLTISPSMNVMTVTYLPKSTDPSTTTTTVTYLNGLHNGQQYTANVTPAGCFTGVVPALWGMDRNDIGTFDSTTGLLTIVAGVATLSPINIYAFVGGLPTATAQASVVVNATDTSAAGSYGSTFTTTGSGTDPGGGAILYPYDGTVLPLGLQPPIVQWNNNNLAASAVKVTLRYPDTSPVFTWNGITNTESPATTSIPALATATGLAAAPRYPIDPTIWSDFAQAAAGNATTGVPAVITVQRYYAGHLYPEQKVRVFFASGQLKGKVYYQSYETQLVKNSDYTLSSGAQVGAGTLAITPGAPAPTLVAGVNGPTSGTGCRVCHVLSGDGSTLLTQTGNAYGQTRRYGVAAGTPVDQVYSTSTNGLFGWAALTSGAEYALTNAGTNIAAGIGNTYSTLYNATTIAAISNTTTHLGTVSASMPAFSPDNSHLAFNYGSTHSLGLYDFNFATTAFSNLRTVYTPALGTSIVAWPTFTPASNQVVFSVQYGGTYGYTWQGATADLWRYDMGTNTTARMTNANGVGLPSGGSGHTQASDTINNFEPTMNPAPTTNTGGFGWVVFTSRRLYGNVATLAASCSDARSCAADLTSPTPKKLWMAAVNPHITSGDPSSPAFYLPGQELLAGNSRGFWVLDQCKTAGTTSANVCDTDLDCCGAPTAERCVASNSIPPIVKYCTTVPSIGSCAPDNTSCSMLSQCCGALTGSQCVLNICTPPPPLVTFTGASFTRDYVGTCPDGYGVTWRFFSWQTYTPGNSSVQFTAQSADDASQITSTMNPPPVGIGTAVSNTAWPVPAQTPGWTNAPLTVDGYLRLANQTSRSILRVTASLNAATSPSQTPVLEDWRAAYDCSPNQ